MIDTTRRRALAGACLLPFLPALTALVRADQTAPSLALGPPDRFDFARLQERARVLATLPHDAAPPRHADLLEGLDYDEHRHIRFRSQRALWRSGEGPYPIEFFHLGKFFKW